MCFPVLRTFDSKRPTILYTDASGLHVGGCLCQELEGGSLVAIAYHSRSLRGPELIYPIQHKEALAIVSSCMAFVHYLLAAHFTVRTCSDHKSSQSCFAGMSKVACDRVTRWVQKICILKHDNVLYAWFIHGPSGFIVSLHERARRGLEKVRFDRRGRFRVQSSFVFGS